MNDHQTVRHYQARIDVLDKEKASGRLSQTRYNQEVARVNRARETWTARRVSEIGGNPLSARRIFERSLQIQKSNLRLVHKPLNKSSK